MHAADPWTYIYICILTIIIYWYVIYCAGLRWPTRCTQLAWQAVLGFIMISWSAIIVYQARILGELPYRNWVNLAWFLLLLFLVVWSIVVYGHFNISLALIFMMLMILLSLWLLSILYQIQVWLAVLAVPIVIWILYLGIYNYNLVQKFY